MFIALVNSVLVMFGKDKLPFEDSDIYAGLSAVATVVSTLWVWWKNNSFTAAAQEADKYLKVFKEENKNGNN